MTSSIGRWLSPLAAVLVIAFLAAASLPGCGGSGTGAGTGAGAGKSSQLDQLKQRGVLRVGIRSDDPPHGFLDAQGNWVGFDIDIASAIARRWKVRLELTRVDELTRISFLQNGKIDLAIASISKTKKRAGKVDFSETYFFSKQSFLVRKGEVSSLDGLAGKRVGADRGSSAVGNWQDWLKAHGHAGSPDIVLFGDKHAAADAVKQGAIAGWAEDYEILASYARADPSLTVLNDPGGIGLKLDGIAMHRNDSALLLAVDLALQDIQSSGDYDQIYDRWFGPASSTPVPRQGSIEVWPNG